MNRSLVAALAAFAGFAIAVFAVPANVVVAGSETYRQLNLYGDVFERVRRSYVREVPDSELVAASIRGMLESLDPHSSYLDAEQFADMQVQTRGEFGGLGLEVTVEDGIVTVISPMDETPAALAGMQAGDMILAIDGKDITGLTLNEAVEQMRGPANTSITLTVMREGLEKPFDLTLTRATIKVASVRFRAEGDIGYIRITSFNEQTEAGLAKAFDQLAQQIGPNLKGYVLDLRNNPGGLLDQSIAVSDAFLERGEVVSTRSRNPQDIERYNARAGDAAGGKPVVILINGGSASASEIVAGALQDHGRAILMGTLSFGKGSVQTIIPLGAGEGALRLTTARYFTPSGRSIQAHGIEPEIEVHVEPKSVETAEAEATPVRRRSEADLRGHLDGDQVVEHKTRLIVYPPEGDTTEDFQLAYALNYLRGGPAMGVEELPVTGPVSDASGATEEPAPQPN